MSHTPDPNPVNGVALIGAFVSALMLSLMLISAAALLLEQ